MPIPPKSSVAHTRFPNSHAVRIESNSMIMPAKSFSRSINCQKMQR